MDCISPGTSEPLKLLKQAFNQDDAEWVATLLERHPEFKARITEPIAPFDAPAITRVRSRAMLDVLLAAGADINAKSRWWAGGFGLLHGATPDLAAYAIERGAIVDIHAAARLGLMEKLRELLSTDPGLINARGGDGQMPLHFAGTLEVAKYLLDHGAEIDARDIDHESTPAQYMIRDRQEIVRYLIQRGCKTDLFMAAALGDIPLARYHLDDNPASIRLTVNERYFPKHDPHSGGTIYIWTLGQNKTPHAIAREFGHNEVYAFLMERTPAELKLALACEAGDEAFVKSFLTQHPNRIESVPEEDRPKLACAAQSNNTGAVRLMLSAGWPVDVRGQHGGTALHWAAFHGNAGMAQTILRYHPPLEWTDADYHSTPLGWAIHGSEEGWYCKTGNYPATVEALLSAGAKLPEKLGGTDVVQEVLRRFQSSR